MRSKLVLAAMFLACAAEAGAAAISWNNVGGGNWSVAANWNGGTVPQSPSQSADVPSTMAVTVDVNMSPTIGSLSIDNSGTTVAILGGNTLTVNNGIANSGTIAVTAGNSSGTTLKILGNQTLSGSGMMLLSSLGSNWNTTTVSFSGNQTLSGGGSMLLEGPGGQYQQIQLNGGTLTAGPGYTINGCGAVSGTGTLVNQGLINANDSNGLSFSSSGALVNSGTIETTGYGDMVIPGPLNNASGTLLAASINSLQTSGSVNNSGGNIVANNGNLQISGGGVTGGTLSALGASALSLGTSLSGVAVSISPSSTLTVAGGSTATITNGTIANSGTIAVTAGNSSGTTLKIAGNQTLSGSGMTLLSSWGSWNTVTVSFSGNQTLGGSGSMLLEGPGGQDQQVQLNGGTLTAAPGYTISGCGAVSGTGTLVNQGLINANSDGTTLSFSSSGALVNSGTIETTGYGDLVIPGPLNNASGTVLAASVNNLQISGTVNNSGGSIVANNGGNLQISGGGVTGGTLGALGASALSLGTSLSGVAVSISPSSTLTVAGGSTATITNGTIANSGTIAVTAGYQGATLNIVGNQTLSSSGTIVLSANIGSSTVATLSLSGNQTLAAGGSMLLQGGYWQYSPQVQLNGGTLTASPGYTISGWGSVSGTGTLVNQGLINANVNSNAFSFSPGGLLNSGTMEATGGGSLVFSGSVNNTNGSIVASSGGAVQFGAAVSNSGGSIVATNGNVQISAGAVTGGTLSALGASALTLESSLNGVALSVSPSSTLTVPGVFGTIVNGTIVNGTIANSGTIAVTAGYESAATLNIVGNQTLSGSGTVLISANDTNFASATVSFSGNQTLGGGSMVLQSDEIGVITPVTQVQLNGGTLTAGPGYTISGWGSVSGAGTLVNQGLINANANGNAFTISTGALVNSGTMEATAGGSLLLSGPVNNASGGTLTGGTWISKANSTLTISSAGGLSANQATVILDGAGAAFSNINSLALNQGSLTIRDGATLTTTGALTNSGSVTVGAGSTLTVSGAYSPQPGSITIADGRLAYIGTMNAQGLLEGSGTAQGSVSLAAGGIIAPGRIGSIGNLTIGGNLGLAGGSTVDIDLAGGSDVLSVAGSLSVSGAATLNFSTSGIPAGGYTLATFQQTNAQPSSFLLAGAPPGESLWVLPNSLVLLVNAPTWTGPAGGSWSDGTKWSSGTAPGGAGATAIVGTGTNTPLTIDLDSPRTLGSLVFLNTTSAAGYTLAKGTSGSLTMDNAGAAAQIAVTGGSHAITANMSLNDSLTVDSDPGSTLRISGNIAQNAPGLSLTLNGAGTLVLSGSDNYSGGTDVVGGKLIVTNNQALADGSSLTVGNASYFGTIAPAAMADRLAPPQSGGIAPAPVPEAGTLALLATAAALTAIHGRFRRRRY